MVTQRNRHFTLQVLGNIRLAGPNLQLLAIEAGVAVAKIILDLDGLRAS